MQQARHCCRQPQHGARHRCHRRRACPPGELQQQRQQQPQHGAARRWCTRVSAHRPWHSTARSVAGRAQEMPAQEMPAQEMSAQKMSSQEMPAAEARRLPWPSA